MSNEKECGCACDSNMKDAVCIQTNRVYDSCKDKECLENLRVYFSEAGQNIIDRATSIRSKRVEVIWVKSQVDEVPFNRGFFAVDIQFFFKVFFECCAVGCKPIEVEGFATYSKKVILFGSEGSAYIFTSSQKPSCCVNLGEPRRNNLPRATIEMVDPIALCTKVVEVCDCACGDDAIDSFPESITELFETELYMGESQKRVFVTIGIFVIVRLERSVQLLIPAYDFCIPEKTCIDFCEEDPCKLFEKLQFPIDEFFPPKNCKDKNCCD